MNCVFFEIQSGFVIFFKKGEIVELHSILLTISPFMFWDDPKIFSESILSLLIFWLENRFSGLLLAVLKNLSK